MVIVATCDCGRKLRASSTLAGRWVKCPQCGRAVLIPSLDAPPPKPEHEIALMADEPVRENPAPVPPAPYSQVLHGPPRAVIAAPTESVTDAEKSWRGYLFWLLLLAMIPLAVETFAGHEDRIHRLDRTLDAHPEVEQKLGPREELVRKDEDKLFALLPGHRLDGALTPRDSLIHWPLALMAAGVFFGIVMFAVPGLPAKPLHLLSAGAFTGTGGVLLLLAIQLVGLFCVCIGGAYIAALDPRAPFGASLLGFFFGVGFFEELIKSLPVLWLLYKYHNVPWRMACLWGMASGAGFGISEGVHYCSNYYNGIEPLGIYFVRFYSCVAFHTLLSGACAILLQRKQHLLEDGEGFGDWLLTFMAIVTVPILLHGLFDTLAKKDMHFGALSVAILSFAWLGFLIRQSRQRETITATAETSGPRVVRTAGGTRYMGPS